jgi:hypothetical protein
MGDLIFESAAPNELEPTRTGKLPPPAIRQKTRLNRSKQTGAIDCGPRAESFLFMERCREIWRKIRKSAPVRTDQTAISPRKLPSKFADAKSQRIPTTAPVFRARNRAGGFTVCHFSAGACHSIILLHRGQSPRKQLYKDVTQRR